MRLTGQCCSQLPALRETPSCGCSRLQGHECLQEPKQMQYPRKPNHKDHYTSDDWKVHGNLSALRSMRIQMLADAMEGRSNGERLVARAKRKIIQSKIVFQD